ncbi:ligase-like protein [Caudoviricetes sp.]|nr:ligase-like protein [Caudoviricetes sp.]
MKPLSFKPILAASKPRDYTDQMFYDRLVFPVIATPKLDGIRCLTRDIPRPPDYRCEVLTRSLKSIPNDWIHYQIGTKCPPGLDGEIITYNKDLFLGETVRDFNLVSSDVMTYGGQPNFKYHVFDSHIESGLAYQHRLIRLKNWEKLPDFCVIVPITQCNNLAELLAYEEKCVAEGYEGICFRDPNSKYKYGRSTLREGHLIKMKRFITEEAVIIGTYEEMANNNPQAINELGYAERTSHSANMIGKGRLGGFHCKLLSDSNISFNVGSGFTAAQREEYWNNRESLFGKIITFKHQPHGALEAPRIPIFIGFRDAKDL